MKKMQLCTFSKSSIHHRSVLEKCPLELTSGEAKKCPCRKRLYNVPPTDLRVLSCTFPDDWQGRAIRDVEQVKRAIDAKLGRKPKAEPKPNEAKQAKERKPAMTQEAAVSGDTQKSNLGRPGSTA